MLEFVSERRLGIFTNLDKQSSRQRAATDPNDRGAILPGRPLANLYFAGFGYDSLYQGKSCFV